MLVTRKDVNPDLIPLLLTVATRIHGQGDVLCNPGEFPSTSYTDIPVSASAETYYKNGPPLLQRYLPFWLASLADRLKVMLVPLVMLLLPLFRARRRWSAGDSAPQDLSVVCRRCGTSTRKSPSAWPGPNSTRKSRHCTASTSRWLTWKCR